MKNKNWRNGLAIFLIFSWVSAVGAADLGDIDIHGFISQGYLKSSENNYLAPTETGTYEFNEMGINFSLEFDKLRIGVQLLSRDLGEFGNNKIVLDWAMGDYQFNEKFGLRAGKVKIPMGLYNQGRDVDMLRVPVFLPSGIYDEGKRDMLTAYEGLGCYGLIDSAMAGEWDYEIYYGTVDVDKDSIYIKGSQDAFGDQIPGSTVSNSTNSTKYITGGALRWNPPLEGARLGFTYTLAETELISDITAPIIQLYTGSPSAVLTVKVDKYEIWVASLDYMWNNLTFVGEYSNWNIDLIPNISGIGALAEQNYTYEAWYLQTAYHLTDWLVVGIYYSEYYTDKDDKDGKEQVAMGKPDYYGWQKDIVPTLRFDINSQWTIKAEVHFIDGAAQVYDYNNPAGIDGSWNLYLLKTTFSF